MSSHVANSTRQHWLSVASNPPRSHSLLPLTRAPTLCPHPYPQPSPAPTSPPSLLRRFLREYPNIAGYVRELYQESGMKPAVDMVGGGPQGWVGGWVCGWG